MNSMIHKYQIPNDQWDSGCKVQMPAGARVLSCQIQHGILCVWVIFFEEAKSTLEERTFKVFGTGHPIKDDPTKMAFAGTVQMEDGDLIFHVFEIA